jgi:hypothetical protein
LTARTRPGHSPEVLTSRLVGALGAAALALTLGVPGAAEASTALGQTFTPTAPGGCVGGPDWEVFNSTASTTVPQAGVLTSWSFEAGSQQTVLTLRVFRPASPGSYTVVGDGGALQTVAASTGLHTFPTRVPVHSGDYIGIHSTSGNCSKPSPTTPYLFRIGTATPVGGTAAYTANSSVLFDIAATLEPDVDGDGFGDETQDACPGSALTQAACPAPDTTITKHPKRPVVRAKIKFTSTVPGSTFRCSLDKRKFKHCSSPLVYACPDPGVHHLKVLATSPYGPVEAKPAKVTFRVRDLRAKGC